MENAVWYVVHTYSGYENKVKTNLEKTVENRNLQDKIIEIRMPEEEVTEVKEDKTKTSKKKLFPGYLFIKMILDNESWYVVRNVRGVTGFVGPGSKPVPLSEFEIAELNLETPEDSVEIGKKVAINFNIGDTVRILDGPLADFVGSVEEIDEQNVKITVLVNMFGRETPVEVDPTKAELLD